MSLELWLLVAFVGLTCAWMILSERTLAILAAIAGAVWVVITLVRNIK